MNQRNYPRMMSFAEFKRGQRGIVQCDENLWERFVHSKLGVPVLMALIVLVFFILMVLVDLKFEVL
jgi:hypothetical protein